MSIDMEEDQHHESGQVEHSMRRVLKWETARYLSSRHPLIHSGFEFCTLKETYYTNFQVNYFIFGHC